MTVAPGSPEALAFDPKEEVEKLKPPAVPFQPPSKGPPKGKGAKGKGKDHSKGKDKSKTKTKGSPPQGAQDVPPWSRAPPPSGKGAGTDRSPTAQNLTWWHERGQRGAKKKRKKAKA